MAVIYEDILRGKRKIHFIGIGGSGMFPLAQILHSEGYEVSGSDNNETDTLDAVRALGIPVFLGHDPKNIEGADIVVYTAAIMKDNPELQAAKASSAIVLERSVMLGLICQRYKEAVCISGTHGKTTTTSMLTQILLDIGMDPTAVIGGKLPSIGGNGRVGKSDIFVCEACEFVDSFLKLAPSIAVILNVDEDHLDYFENLDNIISSFNAFASLARDKVVVNSDDQNTMRAIQGIDQEIVTFGLSHESDYRAANIVPGVCDEYDVYHKGKVLCHVKLSVAGEHNISNSLAAVVCAILLGADPVQAAQSISNFTGASRRLEVLGVKNGITIMDDYAHHPKELRVTLKAVKKMDYNEIWAVFQPFTYSRTVKFLDEFADVLQLADHVVMSEIMGSREVNTYDIYSKDLAEKIPGAVVFQSFEEIADYVMANAKEGDLVITLGCGDIYKAAKLMLK